MDLIKPPDIINYGIAAYFPPSTFHRVERGSVLTTSIYYSDNNPKFNWLICNVRNKLLWRGQINHNPVGTVVLYSISTPLSAGFYTIRSTISSIDKIRKGSITIGLLEPQNRLIIGLPYSAFPSIPLT